MEALVKSDFKLPGLIRKYEGKVRDVYFLENNILVMLVSDRISAFDQVLEDGIPYKGQVLNQIAEQFLNNTSDIVPNWKISVPDSMVTIGHYCKPFPVEMIVRGYLTGSSWRAYKKGKRNVSGVRIPDGMKEHQKFEKPILTPTTKPETGRDEEISREEIIAQNLVSEEDYKKLEEYSLKLFERGTQEAEKRGLILVDTKYEFGKKDDQIYLIDEIHTPDSSRYFYSENYQENFDNGRPQKQLSKEFVREWLLEQGFSGEDRQHAPSLPESFVSQVSQRYIELFEKISGHDFKPESGENVTERIQRSLDNYFSENQ
ncbi:MAG: phosphoribosylaminoimidazolesuccinocarboxamide synthase [Bacteroidota bacterium]|nr:phosphoribosylaminoimidazolesuccinocarboxamide synthase [Bacteroidota bacterium]